MKKFKYSILAVIDGQEFSSKNNTREDFKRLFEMIRSFGGSVIEYTEEEAM